MLDALSLLQSARQPSGLTLTGMTLLMSLPYAFVCFIFIMHHDPFEVSCPVAYPIRVARAILSPPQAVGPGRPRRRRTGSSWPACGPCGGRTPRGTGAPSCPTPSGPAARPRPCPGPPKTPPDATNNGRRCTTVTSYTSTQIGLFWLFPPRLIATNATVVYPFSSSSFPRFSYIIPISNPRDKPVGLPPPPWLGGMALKGSSLSVYTPEWGKGKGGGWFRART